MESQSAVRTRALALHALHALFIGRDRDGTPDEFGRVRDVLPRSASSSFGKMTKSQHIPIRTHADTCKFNDSSNFK